MLRGNAVNSSVKPIQQHLLKAILRKKKHFSLVVPSVLRTLQICLLLHLRRVGGAAVLRNISTWLIGRPQAALGGVLCNCIVN